MSKIAEYPHAQLVQVECSCGKKTTVQIVERTTVLQLRIIEDVELGEDLEK